MTDPDGDGGMTFMQDWTSKAQDRKEWKGIREAFALQWDDNKRNNLIKWYLIF